MTNPSSPAKPPGSAMTNAMIATKKALDIDVWSDIACPWCWVGKRNLEQALQGVEGEVRVHWHAFELDPAAPSVAPDDVDYVAKLAAKYRVSAEQAQSFIDRMVDAGTERGLEFRFDRIRPSNTFNAHRLLAWSRQFGLQDQLKDRLFRAYFAEGVAMSDSSELLRLAGEVGLDLDAADLVLSSDDHRDDVVEDKEQARKMGVSGVPFFVINSEVALSGAQPPELILRAIAHAQDTLPEASGAACTVDGCPD